MEMSKTLNEKDNMNLCDVNVIAVPHDILFPDELNQHLKGQVQFLVHTNGMLQKTITEKDEELLIKTNKISQLNNKVHEYERLTQETDLSASGTPSYIMSAKIIDLSKKLKEKTVECESMKTKCSKLQQKLINFENYPPKLELEKVIFRDPEQCDSKQSFSEEIKILQEKLSQTNNKLFDMKNNNMQLKNDLKCANKILLQEVGDNFSSIQNISNNPNWRGRAQQIITLQQKNAELQEKLSALTEKEIVQPTPKVDPRKQIIEQQQKEITNIKNELDDTKKKLNGSRARVKVLENECNIVKNKLSTMDTKSQNDEKLLSLLKGQLSSLEESNSIIRKEKIAGSVKAEEEYKKLVQEINKEKSVIENLHKIVDERDKKINELNDEIEHLKRYPCSSNRINSPQALSKLKILEVEVNRLLELTTLLNSRLEDERNNHFLTQMNYKKERQRAAKLELKLSRVELENSYNKINNYSTKSITKVSSSSEANNVLLNVETLKNNLELADENISMLKTKLSIIQKEKELDYQRFSSILTETSSMLLKYNTPHQND